MAYMSQERKKQIAQKLKQALKGSGLKYSLAVNHHSTLVMTIISGPIDFYNDLVSSRQAPLEKYNFGVNQYWYKEHYTGESLKILDTIIPILNEGNHDNSDIMTDYFDVGWYLDINVGRWNKPYILTK